MVDTSGRGVNGFCGRGHWGISQIVTNRKRRIANPIPAPNAGIALRFQTEHPWPGVGEFGRYPVDTLAVENTMLP